MDNSILDVALGLSLVFATFALVASGIQEGFAAGLNLRGRQLFAALNELAGQRAGALLSQPLVTGLGRQPTQATTKAEAPGYLPSWLFAAATLDGKATEIAAAEGDGLTSEVKKLKDHIGDDSVLGKVIVSLVQSGAKKGDELEAVLAHWYDGYMERVSGWYKRKTHVILLFVGLGVALAANVDGIGMTRTLLNDPGLRTSLADQAAVAQACGSDNTAQCAAEKTQALPVAQLGLFWTPRCEPGVGSCPGGWFQQRGIDGAFDVAVKIIGLLVGAFAIGLGAPFWFDLIGRGKALKGAGPTPPPAATASAPTLAS